jgi:hypothetical protein
MGFETPLLMLATAPGFLDALLEAYGRWLYESNEVKGTLANTITFFQRKFPALRRSFPRAWDVCIAWAELEPVQHHAPWPLLLVKATAAVALAWNWPLVACMVLGIFRGCLRPCELLWCTRERLIFASESGSERSELLIHHTRPKSHRRAARHQYSTILDVGTIALFWHVFGTLPGHAPLWPLRPDQFKRHLDILFRTLGVPVGIFTAAGLRGGGAIAEFRTAGDIPTIAWRLRVKSTETLGHYLQEASAAVQLRNLGAETRHKLEAASGMYPFYLRSAL